MANGEWIQIPNRFRTGIIGGRRTFRSLDALNKNDKVLDLLSDQQKALLRLDEPRKWQLIERGATNKDLMKSGVAPYAKDGNIMQIHHAEGREPGLMVELPAGEHTQLHRVLRDFGLFGPGTSWRNTTSSGPYDQWRDDYWRLRANN